MHKLAQYYLDRGAVSGELVGWHSLVGDRVQVVVTDYDPPVPEGWDNTDEELRDEEGGRTFSTVSVLVGEVAAFIEYRTQLERDLIESEVVFSTPLGLVRTGPHGVVLVRNYSA